MLVRPSVGHAFRALQQDPRFVTSMQTAGKGMALRDDAAGMDRRVADHCIAVRLWQSARSVFLASAEAGVLDEAAKREVEIELWATMDALRGEAETLRRAMEGLELVLDYVCKRKGYSIMIGGGGVAAQGQGQGQGGTGSDPSGGGGASQSSSMRRIDDAVGAELGSSMVGVEDLGGVSVGVVRGAARGGSATRNALEEGLEDAVGRAAASLDFARKRLRTGGASRLVAARGGDGGRTVGETDEEKEAAQVGVPAEYMGPDGLFNPPRGSAAHRVMSALRLGMAASAARAQAAGEESSGHSAEGRQ